MKGVNSHLAPAASPVGEAPPTRSGGSLQIERKGASLGVSPSEAPFQDSEQRSEGTH